MVLVIVYWNFYFRVSNEAIINQILFPDNFDDVFAIFNNYYPLRALKGSHV